MRTKEITEQELLDFFLDRIAKIEAQVKEKQETLDRFADCIAIRGEQELIT